MFDFTKLNFVEIAIYSYVASNIFESILDALQHIAQFRKPTKDMLEIVPAEKFQEATLYERSKMKFRIFFNLINLAKESLVLLYLEKIYKCSGSCEPWISQDCTLFIIIMLIDTLFKIPFDLYYDFVLEDSFGYNKKSLGTFIYDLFAQGLVTTILIMMIYGGVMYIISKCRTFYIQVGVFVTVIKFLLIWIYPTVIAPIFNKFVLMDKKENLHKKITALAKRVNFALDSIYTMDGSKRSGHSNAYFTGFGKLKRIVFFDTLLSQMKDDDQILAVLCHEFGHFIHSHMWYFMIVDTVALFGGLYAFNAFFNYSKFSTGINLYLFMNIFTPVVYCYKVFRNYISRIFERQADGFAIKYGYGEKLIEALKVLVNENTSTLLHNPLYSIFHSTHPAVIERIENIRESVGETKKKEE